MTDSYDLIAIGSGTAAQVASARVRAAGWKVAVIDHRPFGGTCALRGCDPKKMLVSGEEAIDAAQRMYGHGVAGELRIDWPALMAFKRSFRGSGSSGTESSIQPSSSLIVGSRSGLSSPRYRPKAHVENEVHAKQGQQANHGCRAVAREERQPGAESS